MRLEIMQRVNNGDALRDQRCAPANVPEMYTCDMDDHRFGGRVIPRLIRRELRDSADGASAMSRLPPLRLRSPYPLTIGVYES